MEASAKRARTEVEQKGPEAYVAEFIGTFFLVFAICMVVSVLNGFKILGDLSTVGLVHALMLAVLVYALGGTSGAHLNPAVTVALAALRKIGPVDAVIYIVVQLAGAIAAALVVKLLLEQEGAAVNYGAPALGPFIAGEPGLGLIVEFLGTFILMFAIMAVAVNPRGESSTAGLVIGLALGVAVMAMGPLTGGSFNPARAFGPALVSGSFDDFWLYVIGPLLGALLAGFVYAFVVIRQQDREGTRPVDELP